MVQSDSELANSSGLRGISLALRNSYSRSHFGSELGVADAGVDVGTGADVGAGAIAGMGSGTVAGMDAVAAVDMDAGVGMAGMGAGVGGDERGRSLSDDRLDKLEGGAA